MRYYVAGAGTLHTARPLRYHPEHGTAVGVRDGGDLGVLEDGGDPTWTKSTTSRNYQSSGLFVGAIQGKVLQFPTFRSKVWQLYEATVMVTRSIINH